MTVPLSPTAQMSLALLPQRPCSVLVVGDGAADHAPPVVVWMIVPPRPTAQTSLGPLAHTPRRVGGGLRVELGEMLGRRIERIGLTVRADRPDVIAVGRVEAAQRGDAELAGRTRRRAAPRRGDARVGAGIAAAGELPEARRGTEPRGVVTGEPDGLVSEVLWPVHTRPDVAPFAFHVDPFCGVNVAAPPWKPVEWSGATALTIQTSSFAVPHTEKYVSVPVATGARRSCRRRAGSCRACRPPRRRSGRCPTRR